MAMAQGVVQGWTEDQRIKVRRDFFRSRASEISLVKGGVRMSALSLPGTECAHSYALALFRC